MSTALLHAVGAKPPPAISGPALHAPAPASSADLALLAAQLQTLAEEMGRLRVGLDRLLSISDATSRQGPDPAGLGPPIRARETDPLRAVAAMPGRFFASTAGGAEEAMGRAVWVQERLLWEAQALLGEMMVGSQPAGAAAAFARLRKDPTHDHPAKAAAAAAAAAATANSCGASGAHGDRMELAGRPHCELSLKRDGGLVQHAESASHRHPSAVALHLPAAGQPPVVGRGSLHCSRTGSGRDTPAKVVGSVAAAEAEAWDASQLGSWIKNEGQSRRNIDAEASDGGGVKVVSCDRMAEGAACGSDPSGASQLGKRNQECQDRGRGELASGSSDGELGIFRNKSTNFSSGCISSAYPGRDPCPPVSILHKHCTPPSFSSSEPPWLGTWPALLPSGRVPADLAVLSQAAQAGGGQPSTQGLPDAAGGPCAPAQEGPGGRGAAGSVQVLLPSGGEAAATGGALIVGSGAGSAATAMRYCI